MVVAPAGVVQPGRVTRLGGSPRCSCHAQLKTMLKKSFRRIGLEDVVNRTAPTDGRTPFAWLGHAAAIRHCPASRSVALPLPAICLTVRRENSQLKDVAQVEEPGDAAVRWEALGLSGIRPAYVIRRMNSAASTRCAFTALGRVALRCLRTNLYVHRTSLEEGIKLHRFAGIFPEQFDRGWPPPRGGGGCRSPTVIRCSRDDLADFVHDVSQVRLQSNAAALRTLLRRHHEGRGQEIGRR